MDVRYDYYRLFYHVAKCGSFTRAARELGANQPNVTRSMNRLEGQLGCRLFRRSIRGVELTQEGERLLEHVEIAYRHLRAAELELAQASDLKNETLSIGASETALRLFLLDKLQWFRQTYPGVRMRISNHSTPQALKALEEGKVDFAVVTTPTNAQLPLRETLMLPFREIPVAGPQFESLSRRKIGWKELAGQPLVLLGESTMTWAFYQRVFSEHGIPLQVDIQVATADQILPLVQHNLGVGFLPEPLARRALRAGEIVELHLEEPVPMRYVCLVQNEQRPLRAPAEAFVTLL